jgi:hypothetical protein
VPSDVGFYAGEIAFEAETGVSNTAPQISLASLDLILLPSRSHLSFERWKSLGKCPLLLIGRCVHVPGDSQI